MLPQKSEWRGEVAQLIVVHGHVRTIVANDGARGYYAVDHSVLLYLADRQGRVVQSFHPRQSAQEIAAAVRARLSAESRVR